MHMTAGVLFTRDNLNARRRHVLLHGVRPETLKELQRRHWGCKLKAKKCLLFYLNVISMQKMRHKI